MDSIHIANSADEDCNDVFTAQDLDGNEDYTSEEDSDSDYH